jgi:hypothetical protein
MPPIQEGKFYVMCFLPNEKEDLAVVFKFNSCVNYLEMLINSEFAFRSEVGPRVLE